MYAFSAAPRISVLSTRYLRCVVSATDSGLPVNPTDSVVAFAFKEGLEAPTDLDWATGSWETTSNEYLARCLVGPDGDATLAVGSYTVWMKLVLSPETLVESIGSVVIY